ncbi:MAG TPA: transglycosylase domain-containing protein [Candidatus Obscuribacterales bacterium]
MATRRSKAMRKKSGGLTGAVGRLFRFSFYATVVVAAVGAGYFGASLWRQLQDLPDITLVERYEPIEAIQVYDRYDHLVATVEGDEDRRVIPLNQVSTQMQQAILAAEDHHFYEHHGINLMSIMRATMANLQAGHVVEGGSTITQQLVKNLFFTEAQRNIDRKIKEAYLAWQLEARYPKERILEMYLNQVYFGNNAYGIERAASRYFDRTAAGLSLAQSAFLAGLVKAPSELGSPANRNQAYTRQKEILDKMQEYGYITAKQCKAAKAEKLVFKKGSNPLQKYPYYMSYVLELLRNEFSQAEMRKQGLRVYTNLDPKAQELAEKTLSEAIKKAPKGVSQGALVSVTVSDNSIVAMVGGVGNFWKHQFNRATNPHTAGSSFKPFVYLTAFMKGVVTPDSIIEDTPLVVKQPWGLPDYAPKNFDRKFMGKIKVRTALALSRNVPAVRIAQLAGIDSIVETARLAGITTKLDPNLSLALGSSAVSPLDMASAYSTFVRGGVAIKPQALRRIENNRGQVIQVFESRVDKVFNMEPVARLVDVLQDVVKYGTGTQAKLEDRPVGGKTGTADEGKDIWFIGFTPDLVTAVWGGNDENKPIAGTNVTGGVVMAKIWRDYMKAYYIAIPTPAGAFITPSPSAPEPDKKSGEKMASEGESLPGLRELTKGAVDAADGGAATQAGGASEAREGAAAEPITDVNAITKPGPPEAPPHANSADTAKPAPAPDVVPAEAPAPAPQPVPQPAPPHVKSEARFLPYQPKSAFSPLPAQAPLSNQLATPAANSPMLR